MAMAVPYGVPSPFISLQWRLLSLRLLPTPIQAKLAQGENVSFISLQSLGIYSFVKVLLLPQSLTVVCIGVTGVKDGGFLGQNAICTAQPQQPQQPQPKPQPKPPDSLILPKLGIQSRFFLQMTMQFAQNNHKEQHQLTSTLIGLFV